MSVASSIQFETLPSEILISILSKFSTVELLPITPTSRRIHSLILRIIQNRLLQASSLPNHQIILECFHPASKLSTPYLLCDFLRTSSLSNSKDEYSLEDGAQLSLGQLRNLYSHFRPIKPESDSQSPRAHPAGGLLAIPPNSNALVNKEDSELVCQNIHLDSHERFSQLCTITNLVKVGPRRGLFLSCVNIGEGIMRVFRDWLSERCVSDAISRRGDEKRLLWADSGEHVGLRMRVRERTDIPAPILISRDEEDAVNYTLQYEELVVRTSQLLIKVEQSLEQEVNHSAIDLGSQIAMINLLDKLYTYDFYSKSQVNTADWTDGIPRPSDSHLEEVVAQQDPSSRPVLPIPGGRLSWPMGFLIVLIPVIGMGWSRMYGGH